MRLIGFLIVGMMLANPALAQKPEKAARKAAKAKEISEIVTNKQYRFIAQKTITSGGRNVTLTSEYDLVVDSLQAKAFLPFFGRAYSVDYASQDGGFKFNEKADNYTMSFNEKKGLYQISFQVKTKNDQLQVFLSVGTGGYASLTINSNNRETISYYGEVVALQKEIIKT